MVKAVTSIRESTEISEIEKHPIPTVLQSHKQEEQVKVSQSKQRKEIIPIGRGSVLAILLSTLLVRVASRISFVLLGFYLGEHFASATLVALILEAFYISELLLSPIVGSLSDQKGRKPFLFLAPVIGIGAALSFLLAVSLFPHLNPTVLNVQVGILLLMVLVGRILEGATTALNTPASLGYITDITVGSEKMRTRVMTAFEMVTVGGLALAIPLGGKVSTLLGTQGFFVVIAIHLLNLIFTGHFLKEQVQRTSRADRHSSLVESLKLLRNKRVFTFLPAWLSINTLIGAWITLGTLILTYPNPAADTRHPGQLLYGGFSKELATLLLGGFGLVFLIGMALWTLVLPHLRRTTTMSIGLGGLAMTIIGLSFINSLGENPANLSKHGMTQLVMLLPFVIGGIVLLSGFTPAALTQLAALSETLPRKRGAIMGLYSVALGIGQLLRASVGGLFVDRNGFYGLMMFSALLGLLSLGSVLYMRSHGHDLSAVVERKECTSSIQREAE